MLVPSTKIEISVKILALVHFCLMSDEDFFSNWNEDLRSSSSDTCREILQKVTHSSNRDIIARSEVFLSTPIDLRLPLGISCHGDQTITSPRSLSVARIERETSTCGSFRTTDFRNLVAEVGPRRANGRAKRDDEGGRSRVMDGRPPPSDSRPLVPIRRSWHLHPLRTALPCTVFLLLYLESSGNGELTIVCPYGFLCTPHIHSDSCHRYVIILTNVSEKSQILVIFFSFINRTHARVEI